MKNLPSRISRLEGPVGQRRCVYCEKRPDALIVRERARFEDVQAGRESWDLIEDDPAAQPCPACGWTPEVIMIVETIVEDGEQARALLEIMGEDSQQT